MSRELRVLSWNIGRVYPFGDQFPFAPLIPGIARVLNEADADLILLHEVFGHPVARALHARLERGYDRAMTWMPARSDRETLLFTPPGWTSEVFTSPTRRELMIAHGEHHGARVRVAGVHACAYDSDLRWRFFDALLGRLDDAVQPDLEIIAGDFNIHQHATGSDAALFERLLGEEGFVDADPRGEHTFLGIARLDYALYRADTLDVRADFTCLRGHLQPLQDHDPILATFTW